MASDIGFGDMVNYQANDNSLFFTPIGNQLAGKTFQFTIVVEYTSTNEQRPSDKETTYDCTVKVYAENELRSSECVDCLRNDLFYAVQKKGGASRCCVPSDKACLKDTIDSSKMRHTEFKVAFCPL